jgi:hypothetical protein
VVSEICDEEYDAGRDREQRPKGGERLVDQSTSGVLWKCRKKEH